ncbi:hypothetical protein E2C01_049256 [Portunus trituberculatus]|uniref:Uncharacterized protein n=1 Tax=Portunus trituberculatus TaxID=210409 RepID=A0A5B7GFK7_PORTR|nr:hypothetical protein [Portunus trituberculatus]
MSINWSNRTQISRKKCVLYHDAFPYSFCLLFGGFIQLQKVMWGLK